MSFDSFYGGRQGASFVIVERFDVVDSSTSVTKYAGTYLAIVPETLSNTGEYIYLYNNLTNNFIERDYTNFDKYTWAFTVLDGRSVSTKESAEASSITVVPLPIRNAKGMRQCFEQGGDTTDKVNYGEYVIIDSPNKNDPDNGKVFRRGMNFDYNATSNPYAGGEYIGQICGPAGPASEIGLTTELDVQSHAGYNSGSYDVANSALVPGYDENVFRDNISYSWVTIRDTYGNVQGALIGFTIPYLVPELSGSWRKPYYTQEDYDLHRITDRNLIGKAIPESADFDLFVDNGAGTADRDPNHGDTGHPFFRKWKINIPKGIKGDTQTNLEIYPTLVTEGSKIYPNVNTTTGQLSGTPILAPADKKLNLTNYEATKEKGYVAVDDGGYVYLTDTRGLRMRYLETWYDNLEEGENQFIDIGEYNTITNVTLSEDGWLTVYYSWDDPKVLEEALRWIKYDIDSNTDGIQFNSDGTVTIIYNTLDANEHNETQTHSNLISWINSTTLGRNGRYKVIYNNNNSQISPKTGVEDGKAIYETDLTWPTQVSLTPEGVLKFMYNNNLLDDIYPDPWTEPGTVDRINGSYSFIIPWLDKVKLLRDGHFNFEFNNDELYDPTDPDWVSKTLYAPRITWIDKVKLLRNGHFDFKFNNNGIYDSSDIDWATQTDYMPRITWIDKIKLLSDGHFNFTFNNNGIADATDPDWNASGETYEPRITWITKASLDDDGQLRVYFNNDLNKDEVIAAGGTWIDGPDPEDPTKTAHYYNKEILWVADVKIDDDGTIHFIYCNGVDEIVPSVKIKYLTDVQIETADASGQEGTGDQRVHINYNTGDTDIIGAPLNYVIDTVITGAKKTISDPEEYHLLVYYSDPATRAKYKADPAYNTYSYYSPKIGDIVDDWVDLGYVKGEPGGIHIITNFTDANDLIDSSTGIPIKPEYIDGSTPGAPMPFPNLNHAGWAVTVEDNTVTPSRFYIYFYDYDSDYWYSIGAIDASLIDPRNVIITAEETDYTEASMLNAKGIWLVESTRVFAE